MQGIACRVRNNSPSGARGPRPEATFDKIVELLVGESTPEFRIRDEKRSNILLTEKQPGFGLRAGDAVEDIVVGRRVCLQ